MILKKIIGATAIAGALGFSAIGLAGVANAAPAPQDVPGVAHNAQLVGWHGGGRWGGSGWGGPGGAGWGGAGWGGPGWGPPGWGPPPPPAPCFFGVCV
jgi:hypothetical protein